MGFAVDRGGGFFYLSQALARRFSSTFSTKPPFSFVAWFFLISSSFSGWLSFSAIYSSKQFLVAVAVADWSSFFSFSFRFGLRVCTIKRVNVDHELSLGISIERKKRFFLRETETYRSKEGARDSSSVLKGANPYPKHVPNRLEYHISETPARYW